MSDLSQVAANVAVSSGASTELVQYGEAVTQGQPLYKSTVDGKYSQCDANDTAAKAVCAAIALTPGATDGYGVIAKPGSLVNLGATLAVGQSYGISATKGAINLTSDLASGSFSTVIGIATTTALLKFVPLVSGVQKP